jgi:hypothetical protein
MSALALAAVVAVYHASASPPAFTGVFFDGESSDGNHSLLQLLDIARRSLGEGSSTSADAEIQTMPMLYSGVEDGLLEGPTWGAYWTQNSYGTSMTTVPFLGNVALHGLRESQDWWFDNMADGTTPNYKGFSAPDGTMCDNGEPSGCNFKQGDGNVPIHDWTLEETLSGVVMQAELLVINRNLTAIEWNLPRFLRTFNLIEGRRDFAAGGLLFLSGPSSNLLAPSFGGWPLDNGRHAWSWMTGIPVTYAAALIRAIECAKMLPPSTQLPTSAGMWNASQFLSLFEARLLQIRQGLPQLLAPTGDYFVRSMDPNGTMHGVVGAPRHGYFEASPNHDAVALGVVNLTLAQKIVAKMKSLGKLLRPNVFCLPNTDAHGKPSVTGSGAVGYDDMACGYGPKCGGIFNFGTWVNGGVWTTTEGRWLMAAALTGDLDPAFDSMRQMQSLFGSTWRMDNPIVNFGLSPYQPNEDINLTVDNFATAGGLLRGLFAYIYSAVELTLQPLVPDSIVKLKQKFGVLWGAYSLQISTAGVRSSGIKSVSVNGKQLPSSAFNAMALTLTYDALPPATPASIAAVSSEISTDKTELAIVITFTTVGKPRNAPTSDDSSSGRTSGGGGAASVPSTLAPAAPPLSSSSGPVAGGMVAWFHAADLAGAPGSSITSWKNRVSGGPAAAHPGTSSCNSSGAAAAPVVAAAKQGAVFNKSYLCSLLPMSGPRTLVAAFTATVPAADWGCLLCGRGAPGQDASGFDGVAVGPTDGVGGAQVLLDWTGSDDDTHMGYNVAQRPSVAVATFDASSTVSHVDGCIESQQSGHLETSEVAFIGARGDPGFEYGRFFSGTIHELRAFDRVLNASEVLSISAELNAAWKVSAKDAKCSGNRNNTPTHHCTGPISALARSGPPNATLARLEKFVVATAAPPLLTTHAASLARVALSYVRGFKERCARLLNGTVPTLRSFKAEAASLKVMVTTADSAAAGLANFMDHTVSRSKEAVAKDLLAAWAASAR